MPRRKGRGCFTYKPYWSVGLQERDCRVLKLLNLCVDVENRATAPDVAKVLNSVHLLVLVPWIVDEGDRAGDVDAGVLVVELERRGGDALELLVLGVVLPREWLIGLGRCSDGDGEDAVHSARDNQRRINRRGGETQHTPPSARDNQRTIKRQGRETQHATYLLDLPLPRTLDGNLLLLNLRLALEVLERSQSGGGELAKLERVLAKLGCEQSIKLPSIAGVESFREYSLGNEAEGFDF